MSAPTGSSRATGQRAARSRAWRAAAARLTSSGPPTAGASCCATTAAAGCSPGSAAIASAGATSRARDHSPNGSSPTGCTAPDCRCRRRSPRATASTARAYTGDIITERLPTVGTLAACLRTGCAVGAHLDLDRPLHPPLPRPRRLPCGSQRAQRAAQRGAGVPGGLRSLPAARPGLVARRQPGAPAPLAGEGNLGAAGGALRRGRLARPARWLPPERRASRRRRNPRAALATAVPRCRVPGRPDRVEHAAVAWTARPQLLAQLLRALRLRRLRGLRRRVAARGVGRGGAGVRTAGECNAPPAPRAAARP